MAVNKPTTIKKKIKDYSIISVVGKGGMGEVYLAKHPTLKRGIILKRLSIRDKDSTDRFLREAKLMLEFRHENIVQIYDHFKEGTSTYIAMEYVNGKALNDIIQGNEKIPIPLAMFILYQIALGLFHAHSKKVVHRDIKPHNILISNDGEVKLTDFGIAKASGDAANDITSPGTVIGTPAYMSPEQFSGTADISFQSDIYSLGVVFYEMLTGVKPYKNEFSPEVLTCIARGKCTPATKYIKKLPGIAKKILRKTFNPKSSARYKTLFPLIKLLRKYFKKYNVYEVRESIKRLVKNDKNLLNSPFFVRYNKKRKTSAAAAVLLFGFISILVISTLFVLSNRYYEWVVPDKYGKVVLEFPSANLDKDNIFVGLDGKYEKANFTKKYNIFKGFKIFVKNGKNFELNIKPVIGEDFNRSYYLSIGEHEFSVVSGSYKNTKKVIVSSRMIQNKSKQTVNGQKVLIPIANLSPKDVIVYFRFWDSISDKLLFAFDYYSGKTINRVKREEDNLKIFYNKNYIKLKDYVLLRDKYGYDAFYSDKSYTFLVDGFNTKDIAYDDKKFDVKFSLDDRTVIVHAPLTPKPCKIVVKSNADNIPIIINNESYGLVFVKNQYVNDDYKKLKYKKIAKNSFYGELLIPPGTFHLKISKDGKLLKHTLKSDGVLEINVKKENGKFIY